LISTLEVEDEDGGNDRRDDGVGAVEGIDEEEAGGGSGSGEVGGDSSPVISMKPFAGGNSVDVSNL